MNNKKIFLIIMSVLAVTGIVFLIMSMVSTADNHYLAISLGCINIATLMNICRMARQKK